jgi:AcrR family transcriptional regulator
MRTRTEERRQRIIDVAIKVFMEQGFERASMAEISERVGGSKATLYGYFSSKEELFIAGLRKIAAEEAANASAFLANAKSLREGLERFGYWRLRTTLTPGGFSVRRMIWSEASRETVQRLYGSAEQNDSSWARLAHQLGRAMERGEIRKADPWTAAQHYRGLLETDAAERAFLSFPTPLTDELLHKAVREGVDAFMRAYAPEPDAAVQRVPRKRKATS